MFSEFVETFAVGKAASVSQQDLKSEDLELMAMVAARGLSLARNNFPQKVKDTDSWEDQTLEARAEALGLEVFQDGREGEGGRSMGRGLRLGAGHLGCKEGDLIACVYGTWGVAHSELAGNKIRPSYTLRLEDPQLSTIIYTS